MAKQGQHFVSILDLGLNEFNPIAYGGGGFFIPHHHSISCHSDAT